MSICWNSMKWVWRGNMSSALGIKRSCPSFEGNCNLIIYISHKKTVTENNQCPRKGIKTAYELFRWVSDFKINENVRFRISFIYFLIKLLLNTCYAFRHWSKVIGKIENVLVHGVCILLGKGRQQTLKPWHSDFRLWWTLQKTKTKIWEPEGWVGTVLLWEEEIFILSNSK